MSRVPSCGYDVMISVTSVRSRRARWLRCERLSLVVNGIIVVGIKALSNGVCVFHLYFG